MGKGRSLPGAGRCRTMVAALDQRRVEGNDQLAQVWKVLLLLGVGVFQAKPPNGAG